MVSEEVKALARDLEKLFEEGKVAEFVGYIPEEEELKQALEWMSMVGIESVVSEKWKYKAKPSKKVRVLVVIDDF